MFTNWLTSDTTKIQRDHQPSHSSPELIIEVGPSPFTRFPAHSSILSSQSGYFRAAIFRLSESGGKLNENVIFLPNISVEHFTPLLSYMYTGYLELNFENIFGVLLATHLLHMPRALEICRDFLAQTQRHHSEYFPLPSIPLQSSSSNTSKIIRPIASKASNYGLNFISPPKASSSNLLFPSIGTKFKSLSGDQESAKITLNIEDKKVSEEEKEKNAVVKKSIKISASPAVIASKNIIMEANDKVVIDIASCDGPVRFKRVLNDAFEQKKLIAAAPQLNESKLLPSSSEVKFHSSVAFHEQMVRNINEQYKKTFQNSEESENSQHSNIDIYTCVYCNHTFKSKYCYQKHAKRHINPLNPLGRCRIDIADCESSDGEYKKQQTPKRDSIKPLDMNVQYYPCKYCGCKFPSYYFVHKHRKLCHPEVEAGEGNSSVHNQQEEEKEMEVTPTSDEKMEN